jgi:hypothetical protein
MTELFVYKVLHLVPLQLLLREDFFVLNLLDRGAVVFLMVFTIDGFLSFFMAIRLNLLPRYG